MPLKGRSRFDIDVDPDLLKGTLQPQAQKSQRSKPKQRPGPSTPAAQPGAESGQSGSSASRGGSGTPTGGGRGNQTSTHQSGSIPRRWQSRTGVEIDPDLVASATQSGRASPMQPIPKPTTAQATPTPSASRPSAISNAGTNQATPVWRPGAPILKQTASAASRRPTTSSVTQAGRYSTPSARHHGSKFAPSTLRSSVVAKNYLEEDDIEDTSPEAKTTRRTTTQQSATRPVSRAASILSHNSSSRAPSSKPQQPGLPSLIGARPLRATNAMEIDDDSIHSSSPPERISESVSPRKAKEVVVKQEIESEDDDTATIVPEREIRDSQDEEDSDEDESQADHPGVQFITETTTGLDLDRSATETETESQEGKPKKQTQFRKPPKFTFKRDEIPKDRPQFTEPPIFTFKANYDPKHRPNPRKYRFKEDIRPPTESPPPVPEQEPEPQPQPDADAEADQPKKKKKKPKRLLKAQIPGGLADSLRQYMIYDDNTLPKHRAVANSRNHFVKVDICQHLGGNRFGYWLVRARMKAKRRRFNGDIVHLLLPGNGWHAWHAVADGESVDEVVYNPIEPKCIIGVRGERWQVELEGITWFIVPDWFIVQETEAPVRRNVHYDQDGSVCFETS